MQNRAATTPVKVISFTFPNAPNTGQPQTLA